MVQTERKAAPQSARLFVVMDRIAVIQNYLVTSKYATKEGHEATHHTHTHIQTSREEIGRRSMTGKIYG